MTGFSFKPELLKLEPKKFPESEIVAILDLDFPKYAIAGVGENRSIIVRHKETDWEKEFDTRTDFWGRGKQIGGWLGKLNAKKAAKGEPLATKEDFEIEDVVEPEPLENVLHSAKLSVLGCLEALGTDKYEGYIGKGDSFRVGLSTLKKYKGSREDKRKPIHLDAVTEYLKRTFKGQVVQGIEADDKVVMRAYGDPNAVIVGVDKDYRGQPIKFFDVNNPKEGIINGDCFGELRDTGKKITGYGRIFMYWQMITEDSIDEYKANCFSDLKWGAKSGYKALADCKNDQEALQVVIEVFKRLYPEPKMVTGWRGNEFLIDWLYVANEMFQMARMLRWEGDIMHFENWCQQYEVTF